MKFLDGQSSNIKALATKHLSVDRLFKFVSMAVSKTPRLLDCYPPTVLQAVMDCSKLGLAPGTLGQAYLVPFRNGRTGRFECQLIVGYQGLMTLARRSGEISFIQADVVRAGDVWEYRYTEDGLKMNHVPAHVEGDRPLTHAWCVTKFKDGGKQVTVMTRAEIDKIRKRSKSGGDGPWVTDYEEMAKKTVLRRASKTWPLTPELLEAIETADAGEFNFSPEAADAGDEAPEEPIESAKAAVESALGGKPADEKAKVEAAQEKIQKMRTTAAKKVENVAPKPAPKSETKLADDMFVREMSDSLDR